MADVRRWLASLDLEQYAEAFEENAVALDQVATLTDDELRELGVRALGHRKRIRDHAASGLEVQAVPPNRHTPVHLAEQVLSSRAAVEGERKQVTVLFADLVGSTALICDLDAEQAVERLRPAIDAMMTAVHRNEGLVNRVQGDGIMALFGAPIAHEDHAVRACLAALDMRDAVCALADDDVRVRVGLNSGEVVVRAIRNDLTVEYEADGPTVHFAARMEQVAAPDTVLATELTARLAEGYVEWRRLGAAPVKGSAEPVPRVEILRPVRAASRWEIRARRGLTRYVGRRAELGMLDQALALAAEGHGQVVSLVGEPGMGKSRLVHEFLSRQVTGQWTVLVASASSYGTDTPYLPIRQLLRSMADAQGSDDASTVAAKLDRFVDELGPEFAGTGAAIRSVAGLPGRDEQWAALEPSQRRRRSIDVLRGMFLRQADRTPLLLVFEDLHWWDAETQAVLDALVDSMRGSRLMLLASYRPDHVSPWSSRSWHRAIPLSALGASDTDALVRALLGDHPSVVPLLSLLVESTEGRPLFVEETVRALAEEGHLAGAPGRYRLTEPIEHLRIPNSVQAVLAARIDRLDPETKRVLQTAAVIGRQAPFSLLESVCDLDGTALVAALRTLQSGEFLYERQVLPEPEYAFKHALTESAAYDGLLRSHRVRLHGTVLDVMTALQGAGASDVEALARHAFQAERWQQAVAFLRAAVDRATDQSAHLMAREHLERGLSALGHLPDSAEWRVHGVDFRLYTVTILWALGRIGGIAPYLKEAEKIAASLGDRLRHPRVLYHLCLHSWLTGDYTGALKHGERGRQIAMETGDTHTESEMLHRMGSVFHSLGDYRQGVDVLRRAEVSVGSRSDTVGLPLVNARQYLVYCLVELGELREALRTAEATLAVAQASGRPWAVIDACMTLGVAHLGRGTPDEAIPPLEQALELLRESEIPMLYTWVGRYLGTAYLRCGRVAEGIRHVQDAVEAASDMGILANLSHASLWLAEGYLRGARPDDAADAARRALTVARTRGEQGHEAWALWLLAAIAAREAGIDREVAERNYDEALRLSTKLGMRPVAVHCYHGLAVLKERDGDQTAAREFHDLAVGLSHEMGLRQTLLE